MTVGMEFRKEKKKQEKTHVSQKSLLKKRSERGWGKPREKVSEDPQRENGQWVGLSLGVECRQRLTGVVGKPTQDSADKPCSVHDFSESPDKSVQVPCQDGLVRAACCREVTRAEGQPGTGRAWSPKTCDVRETDHGLGCRRLGWRWTVEKLWYQWIFSSMKCCLPLLGLPFPPLSRSAEPGWGQCVSSEGAV